jgi:cytochrome c biogenesis protein CcmG, thiol:disulfide interchange protein DsbE
MATATTKRSLSPVVIIVAVVAAIVIAAAVLAVVAGGSDGDSADAPAAVAETFDVTVKGSPLPAFGEGGADPAVGMMAPTLLGSNFDGTPRVVDPVAGTPQLIVFLAHWCPACNQEVPELVKWYEDGGVPAGLQVTAVSTGVREGSANYPPSRWFVKRNWPSAEWRVMADSSNSDAGNAFGVRSYPSSVIIGSDGRVLARHSGVLGLEAYEAWVLSALANDGV